MEHVASRRVACCLDQSRGRQAAERKRFGDPLRGPQRWRSHAGVRDRNEAGIDILVYSRKLLVFIQPPLKKLLL